MITLYYATEALLKEHGLALPTKTVRAIVAIEGDEVVGTAGIYSDRSRTVMYADLGPKVRADKRTIVKGIRMLAELCRRHRAPVHSLADPTIPGSAVLLEHIGFKHLTGALYQWQP